MDRARARSLEKASETAQQFHRWKRPKSPARGFPGVPDSKPGPAQAREAATPIRWESCASGRVDWLGEVSCSSRLRWSGPITGSPVQSGSRQSR
jgi:hypothetical protein